MENTRENKNIPMMASELIRLLQRDIELTGDKPVIMDDLDTGWFFDIIYEGVTSTGKNYKISANGGYGNDLETKEI